MKFNFEKSLIGIMLCGIILLGGLFMPVQAQGVNSGGAWEIPFLGTVEGPEGFRAVDLKDWVKAMEPYMEKAKDKLPDKGAGAAAGKPLAVKPAEWPADLGIYQLQVDDGQAVHIAAAIAYKDSKPDFPQLSPFFTPELTAEQQDKLAVMNNQMKMGVDMAQAMFAKTDEMKVRILDFSPIGRLNDSPEVVYTVGGRIIVDMKGLVMPAYAKLYALQREGKTVFVLIASYDSDAKFWEGVVDSLIVKIK